MPAGDGPGTSVDTSAMGKEKTIVVGGSFVGATVAIEVSTDDAGLIFQPLTLFSGAGKKVIDTAAKAMRVNIAGRSAEPFSANADVGANDIGGSFIDLVVPAADGVSAGVDISALGNFTTIIAGGAFREATLTVEVSEDGVSYAPCGTFQDPGGIVNKELIANFARVRVQGRDGNTFPFTPDVSMGATNDAASGGIGATGESFINTLSVGEGLSHNSDTPLVVSQFELNPLDYTLNNATLTMNLRVTAANGGGAALTRAEIYNLTDSESVGTLAFNSAVPSTGTLPLVIGAAAGQIKLSSKIYEIRIEVDSPDLVDDTIELGSAEIQIINTVD